MRIAICGAGAAGLTLAARLAQDGARPVLFEARDEATLAQEGIFLTLAPNGMNGLKAIGACAAVEQAGVRIMGVEIRNGRGTRLGFADQSDLEQVFGAPSVTLRRGELARILLERARASGADVRLGVRVAAVQARADGVCLTLNDGRLFTADLLVAADGLRSSVRAAVFPEYPLPQYTGMIGAGGITEAEVPHTGGILRMCFGDNAFFGYVKPSAGPVYWFNSYGAPAAQAGPVLDAAAYARRLQALHAHDPAPNAEIMAQVQRMERNYPIYDMPRLPAWHRGRVMLIGDAAHAVGPHAGQGASMAIEDALVLAACLHAGEDFGTAFAGFERLRRARVAQVHRLTARNARRKRSMGRVGLFIRDLLLPLLISLGIRRQRRLYAFRPDLAPLQPPPP
ncbi:MAG TPA: FAD-dependent monooxygenase [Burkholderiales bacterium]